MTERELVALMAASIYSGAKATDDAPLTFTQGGRLRALRDRAVQEAVELLKVVKENMPGPRIEPRV